MGRTIGESRRFFDKTSGLARDCGSLSEILIGLCHCIPLRLDG